MEHPLLLIQISIQYNLQKSTLVKTMANRMIYAFSISCKTSASVGSDGIAPFFVVVIAPHALANLIDSTSFFSSCKVTRYQISVTSHGKTENFRTSFTCRTNNFSDQRTSFRQHTCNEDGSLTILRSRAPTNASPAPVVSTCCTLKEGTAPWKSCNQAK